MPKYRDPASFARQFPVRLACRECDREDFDCISQPQLDAAPSLGWQDIGFVQSGRDAFTTYDNPEQAPPGYSVLDWYTHLGLCPDCARRRESTHAEEP